METMRQIGTRVRPDTFAACITASRKERRTLGEWLRLLLEDHFEKPKKLRKRHGGE